MIPTSELTLDNVPLPGDPDACAAFALTFDGYGFVNGGPAELMDYLRTLPSEDGIWDIEKLTVDDIRADLFMEQRATRWNCQCDADELEREEWKKFGMYAAWSVRMIRHKLFGEPLLNE